MNDQIPLGEREKRILQINEEILQCKLPYSHALEMFNKSKEAGEPREKQVEFFTEFRNKGISFFNCVEKALSDAEVAGAFQSRFWAEDFARTSGNVLENVLFFYDKHRKEASSIDQPELEPSRNAYSGMQNMVAIYNPSEAQKLRKLFKKAKLPTVGFDKPIKMNKRYNSIEKSIMFVTVVVFMLILLLIGIWNQNYTPQGFFILRVILGIIAAAFAAIAIPGFLSVEARFKRFTISAIGAIGVFVIIYLLNPPTLLK